MTICACKCLPGMYIQSHIENVCIVINESSNDYSDDLQCLHLQWTFRVFLNASLLSNSPN